MRHSGRFQCGRQAEEEEEEEEGVQKRTWMGGLLGLLGFFGLLGLLYSVQVMQLRSTVHTHGRRVKSAKKMQGKTDVP